MSQMCFTVVTLSSSATAALITLVYHQTAVYVYSTGITSGGEEVSLRR